LRLKILKKLRTASLNSEFTGSYKKVYAKTALFSLKSCKNRPVLGYPPPAALFFWRISPIGEGIKGASATTGNFLTLLRPYDPPDT